MNTTRNFAETQPLLFVVALFIFQTALAIPVVAVGKALGTPMEPLRLLVPVVQSVFILCFIWTMGWSRACGLTGTVRNAHLLIFPAIVLFVPALLYGSVSIPAAGVSLFFFAVLATGISEEGLARGVAIPLLLRYGKWGAVLLAAVMFSFGHLTNAFFNDFSLFDWIEVFAATFGMGVLYGALFLSTGSLVPLIYLHTIEDYIYVTSGTAGPYVAVPIEFGPHLLLSGAYVLAGLLLMFTVSETDIAARRIGDGTNRRGGSAMLGGLVAFSIAVSTGSVVAQTRDDLSAAVAAIEASAPAALARHGVPGVGVAMVIGGEPVWTGGFGVADVETGAGITAESVFEIASVTKPVTAWAILRLAEQGRIDLDAPIETYLDGWTLPQSEFDHAGVTARAILAHGAGLGAGCDSGGPPSASVPSLKESANGAGMEYGPIRVTQRPGDAYLYSSKGFVLLEMAVETITGEPFGRYVTREVLDPLGMSDSSFGWTPELESRAAWGHDWYGRRLPHYSHATKAQGGIVATATDLARFLAASMRGPDGAEPGRGVISPSAVQATFAPFPFKADQSTVGLGYNLHLGGEIPVARKTGDHRGYKAVVFTMPEIGAGLVILANSDRAAPGVFADIACPWSRALSGDPMQHVCGQLSMLRNAHLGVAGVLALIGMFIAWRVVAGLRRGTRGLVRRRPLLRYVGAGLLAAFALAWWGFWYSDIPLRLQGFPPTFYTVRATLWPTAFVWVSWGLTVLATALMLSLLFPKMPPKPFT